MRSLKPIVIFGESILPGENKTYQRWNGPITLLPNWIFPLLCAVLNSTVPWYSFGRDSWWRNQRHRNCTTNSLAKNKQTQERHHHLHSIINMYGFVNKSREFPDGRDLNRSFPKQTGSLASRFAFHILTEVMPLVNYAIDFHAGGASRFNAPQIRTDWKMTPNSNYWRMF